MILGSILVVASICVGIRLLRQELAHCQEDPDPQYSPLDRFDGLHNHHQENPHD